MKNLRALLGSILSLLVIGLMSCKKDPCKEVNCQNGGTCSDGNCTCSLPWEGNRCEVDVRTKFLGTWTGTRRCTNSPALTDIELIFDLLAKDSLQIAIPAEIGPEKLQAKLTSSTDFTIPRQSISVGTLTTFAEGQGSWQNGRLSVEVRYGSGVTCQYENLSK